MDELSSNNHSNGFHSADIISTAYVASLSFFDFFAICLNILLLLSMKKDQYNATEKMQITKTAFLIFAGVICIPLDIVATTRKSTSLMLYFGKGNFTLRIYTNQHTPKPTIRLVQPAKTEISLRICAV